MASNNNGNIVSFTALVVLECSIVVKSVLYKAATKKGLNEFVFTTYSYAFGALLLLPISLIFSRRDVPWLKLTSVVSRISLLSVIAFLARITGYRGIKYSSPALSSSISTLTPAFTFILAVIFRMEKLNWRSTSTQAKIIGTLILISGALVMVLCKGPIILSPPSTESPSQFLRPISRTTPKNWALGGLLLVIDNLLNAACFILQTHIIKMYPNELAVAFTKCLIATIVALPVSLMAEREDSSVWLLKPDITMIAVGYSAIFGPALITTVHFFCLHLKGPIYVASFIPLSMVLSTAICFVFLGDAIHLGSVLGATILLIGFYAVLYGKGREGNRDKDFDSNNMVTGSLSNGNKTALLQGHIVD